MKYGPDHADILFEITKANEIIQISVIDNGSGVNQSDSEKIFEPFHRSTQLDTKEHESGSGLGLAIAKQAIELNKGEIQAITTKDNFEIKIKLPIRAESKF